MQVNYTPVEEIQARIHNYMTSRSGFGSGGMVLNHRLVIGGEDVSDQLISADVTYSTDAGGSGAEFTIYGDWEDYQDAPCRFFIGYGDEMINYFSGALIKPRYNDNLYTSSMQAFGPFRLMTTQVLAGQETFVGKTLEWVIMDCARRAGYKSGEVEVRGGSRFVVPQGEMFTYETTLADIVNTVCEKADYVGMDMPGGKRLFLPRPRPGANASVKTFYNGSDYVSFATSAREETSFNKVVVYRRDDRGNFVVFAEQDVGHDGQFQPPKNRVYIIPDFVGSQLEAGNVAMRNAIVLRNGDLSFDMTAPINPAFMLYDGFRATTSRNLPGRKREERVYNCTIDSGIKISYSAGSGSMNITGTANEIKSARTVIKEGERPLELSTGIIRHGQPPKKVWSSWDDDSFYFEDIEDTWSKIGKGV